MTLKRILLFFLLLQGAFSICAQTVRYDSSYANSYYKQRLEFFQMLPKVKKQIVFLGNSITEGGPWQELVRNKNVTNRGYRG